MTRKHYINILYVLFLCSCSIITSKHGDTIYNYNLKIECVDKWNNCLNGVDIYFKIITKYEKKLKYRLIGTTDNNGCVNKRFSIFVDITGRKYNIYDVHYQDIFVKIQKRGYYPVVICTHMPDIQESQSFTLEFGKAVLYSNIKDNNIINGYNNEDYISKILNH